MNGNVAQRKEMEIKERQKVEYKMTLIQQAG